MPLESSEIPVGRATFILSLDLELGWGSFDKGGVERCGERYAGVREAVEKILSLLEQYRISATWGVVGHLFLESCSTDGPDSHSNVLQPSYSWYPGGWASHDPHSNVREAPFFYAPDIVERLMACAQPQEIASHTFTHAILGDPECTRDVARSQIEACRRVAAERGIETHSLIFPRNLVGHLDVLAETGVRAFRGPERRPGTVATRSGLLSRVGRGLDAALARTPCVYETVSRHQMAGHAACYDLPASMFLPPLDGVWRYLPVSRRLRRAERGIAQAVSSQGLFHLWFHPFNLAGSPALIDCLEAILARVATEVEAERLAACTMAEAAHYLDHQTGKEANHD